MKKPLKQRARCWQCISVILGKTNRDKKAFLLMCTLLSGTVHAKDITAKSLQFQDVKNAVNVALSGDNVLLPSGKVDWGNNTLIVPGGVRLIGKGHDKTVIIMSRSDKKRFLVIFDCANGLPVELHNVGFRGFFDPKQPKSLSSGVSLSNGCTNFKLSKNAFTGFANAAIEVDLNGTSEVKNDLKRSKIQHGVIYQNRFVDNYYSSLNTLGYGVAVYGDRTTWSELSLGTKNAIFVEDNFFSGNRHHIASNGSSQYVFRYNQVIHTAAVKNYDMTDVHGKSIDRFRGSRSFEIYHNQYIYNGKDGVAAAAVGIRGGDGVIFNNRVSKNIVKTVSLYLDRFGTCGATDIPDRTTSLYIWDNEHNDDLYANWAIFTVGHPSNPRNSVLKNGVTSKCPESIKEGKHYHLEKPSKYTPFPYPHFLRSDNAGKIIFQDSFE